jgi:hypothetical protein
MRLDGVLLGEPWAPFPLCFGARQQSQLTILYHLRDGAVTPSMCQLLVPETSRRQIFLKFIRFSNSQQYDS